MPAATTPPTPNTLPPPQLFDILPSLHSLLSRLLLPPSADGLTPSLDSITPISPKDLATAASSITNKIQKARTAVRQLPGVDMAIEEQQDVIAELEEESRRLRGVEEAIRKAARKRLEGAAREVGAGNADYGAMETGSRNGVSNTDDDDTHSPPTSSPIDAIGLFYQQT
ncbi:MAG: hypothetical protein Q9175_004206 [Cornicularia normoerica]